MTVATATGADCIGGANTLVLPEEREDMIKGTIRKHLDETGKKGWIKKRLTYSGPGTGNCLIRRDLFGQVGLFDVAFTHRGEDQDFFRRARKAGYKIASAPRARVRHIILSERLEPGYLLALSRGNGRTIAYLDFKEWGSFRAACIGAARMIHAVCVTSPKLLWAYVTGDGGNILSRKCSLCTAAAYAGETLSLFRRSFSDIDLPVGARTERDGGRSPEKGRI